MDTAKDLLLDQRKLLSRGQLPLTGKTGEARKVIHVPLSPTDPVCGVNVAAAAGAPGAISSTMKITFF